MECPEKFQTSGKRLPGRLMASARRPKGTADIISTCVNKMWGTTDSPGLKFPHSKIPMSTLQLPAKMSKAVFLEQREKSVVALIGHLFKTP